mgnify:CR=1
HKHDIKWHIFTISNQLILGVTDNKPAFLEQGNAVVSESAALLYGYFYSFIHYFLVLFSAIL